MRNLLKFSILLKEKKKMNYDVIGLTFMFEFSKVEFNQFSLW